MNVSFCFRPAGGNGVGLGHIKRCLVLAEELRSRNYSCVFWVTEDLKGQIERQGFSCLCEKDGPCETRNTVLIADEYGIADSMFEMLSQRFRSVVYIDDLNLRPYPVDMVINGNPAASEMIYQKSHRDQVILKGADYLLIHKRYRGMPPRIVNPFATRWMITTGATDITGCIPAFIRAFTQWRDQAEIVLEVVIGPYAENRLEIHSLCQGHHNIILHDAPEDLISLQMHSDIALCAGGSTMYELCATGTPAMSVVIAGNQREISDWMNRHGVVICLGESHAVQWQNVVQQMGELAGKRVQRELQAQKMQQLIDGRGAERVADEIMKMIRGD